MRSVHSGAALGLSAQLVLLAVLGVTVGLSASGWLLGLASAVVTNVALARGLVRAGSDGPGPADLVTLARAALVGGVAALVAGSIGRPAPVSTLVGLTVVALVLDGVDGRVARSSGTVSELGARFDLEVDAFLILVLSIYVAPSVGWWVLLIGAARYTFVAARWLLPWMSGAVPARYWCKVVAVVQGVVLTVAAADVLPHPVAVVALVAALALLAESFGREVWWLWRERSLEQNPAEATGVETPTLAAGPGGAVGSAEPVGQAGGLHGIRRVLPGVATGLAVVIVWVALLAPDELGRLRPSAFLRIPLEALVVGALVVVLPVRARRTIAALSGVVLGLVAVVKIVDMGFFATLGRPFDPATDWGYFGPAVGVLGDSVGRAGAIASAAAAVVLVAVLLVVVMLSVRHLSLVASSHRTGSIRAVAALGVVWILCAAVGVQIVPGAPVASTSAGGLAYDQLLALRAGASQQQDLATAVADDPFRDTPGSDLLTGLRGKDVIVAFVESYGRVAVQGSTFSPRIDTVLDSGTTRLRAAGFSSRSAFLTSSTFGGISWLAHSTLQSGLWIDNQQRYDQLVTTDRLTLSGAFKRAGWRTVADVPSNERDWPEGSSFYGYDKVYDHRNVGYHGPKFSYAEMPDQYVLAAYRRLELARPHHTPVMAELDLVSSHTPWTPLPHLVDWNKLGDGSIFDPMPAQGQSPDVVWRDPDQVRALYGQSVEYTLEALVSFVQTYHDDNLVLVVLGDHQPATIVSGQGASHDVPITIIAHDPAVMARISGWGWQDGLRPGPEAPVWPMSAFRDRFLTAYGPAPSQAASPSAP